MNEFGHAFGTLMYAARLALNDPNSPYVGAAIKVLKDEFELINPNIGKAGISVAIYPLWGASLLLRRLVSQKK